MPFILLIKWSRRINLSFSGLKQSVLKQAVRFCLFCCAGALFGQNQGSAEPSKAQEPVYIVLQTRYQAQGDAIEAQTLEKRYGKDSGRRFKNYAAFERFCRLKEKFMASDNAIGSAAVTVESEERREGAVRVRLLAEVTAGAPIETRFLWLMKKEEGLLAGFGLGAANMDKRMASAGGYGAYYMPEMYDHYRPKESGFELGAYLSNIYAGPVLLGASYAFNKKNPEIDDLGRETYITRSLYSIFTVTAAAAINDDWQVKPAVVYTWYHKNTRLHADAAFSYRMPLNHSLSLRLNFEYDQAKRLIPDRQGLYARLGAGDDVFFPDGRSADNRIGVDAEAAYFWRFFDWLMPSVRAAGLVYSGRPFYDLAKRTRGIGDYELKGNAGLFLNVDVRMRMVRWPNFVSIYAAPFIDYGWAFDFEDRHAAYNNGFGTGLDFTFVFDWFAAMPLTVTLGYDLRSKYAPNNFAKRFYFDANAIFRY